jgi:hypothetical protein
LEINSVLFMRPSRSKKQQDIRAVRCADVRAQGAVCV